MKKNISIICSTLLAITLMNGCGSSSHNSIKSENTNENIDSIQKKVKASISSQHEDGTWQLRQVVLTPSKQKAIVETSTDQESYLTLYSIENPNNPKEEYIISTDDIGHARYKDITMLGNNKIRYTTHNYDDSSKGDYVTVTYDYINKQVISKKYEGESLSKIEKRLNDSIENEKKNINENPTGGLMNVSVKIYDKTSDGRLIASTTAVNGNAKHVYFGIFNEDDLNYHDILAINWYDSNILTNFYSSPGYEYGEFAKLISLDDNIITYKVRGYNSDEGDATVTYDYINKKIISKKHEGEALSNIEDRLNTSIEDERQNIKDDPQGGVPKITIKIFDKTSDGRFITSITDTNGNRKKVYFGIFDEDDLNYSDILHLNSDSSNILTYYHGDSGVESGELSKFVSLDKNAITYKVRAYNSDKWVVKTYSIGHIGSRSFSSIY